MVSEEILVTGLIVNGVAVMVFCGKEMVNKHKNVVKVIRGRDSDGDGDEALVMVMLLRLLAVVVLVVVGKGLA